jgi:alanine dehydrogenase
MRIGVPKEIKIQEYRVGMIPAGVHAFVSRGHEVLVQSGAGLGSGLSDADYAAAGAQIAPDAAAVYGWADMIMKVKEPIAPEYGLLREGQILYTICTSPRAGTPALVDSGCVAIAFETVQLRRILRSSPPTKWPAGWRSGRGAVAGEAERRTGPAPRRPGTQAGKW